MRFLIAGSISGLLLFYFACQQINTTCEISFYHWQQSFNLTDAEETYLDSLQVKKIYLRFFDVDYNFNKNETKPLSILSVDKVPEKISEIVPTIFITNRTLLQLKEEDLNLLVEQILKKITSISENFESIKIREIQIDCDWSEKTKILYFELLRILKTQLQKQNQTLSATIRLHQVKYFQRTGVPPVNRGILMFYNMGQLEKWESTNSILDLQVATSYLFNFDRYPLSLDIALPIFSWGVLFRDGKMIRLLNQLSAEDLSDPKRFLKLDKNRYEVAKSTYLHGHYLYQKDKIRLEIIRPDDLESAVEVLQPYLKKENRTLIFYHLDSTTINSFPYEILQQLGLQLAQ